MSKNNVRIAIRDSTDSHNVAFFDNKAGIKYKSANLHRFLAGSASILTIKYNSKDIDSIRSGCKLAFRYKNRDYWLNVMSSEKKGFKVELTAYSLGLELNNETRGEHKPANAMSIAEYVAYYDPEHALTIGVNEVSDKRIKLEWTGTDTILARLFSVANSFGAELDFNVELNDDYSLKRQVLNIYKKGNLGTNKVSQPVRVGKELKVINYSDNIKELRTAVRATGKDGLTIDGLNKKIYDDNKELLYYSSGMTVYAPQSRDRFPSVGKGSNDNWIVEDLGETQYETKEALWGYMYGEIQKKSLPEITYEVEGAIEAGIGDTQTLIDDIHFEPALYVQARVSELEDDILTGKVTNSTFINFERKYSQIADSLLKQVEALAEEAAPYIVRLSTDNGYNFKNGQGTSTITAKLEKYSKIVNAKWKWLINNSVVSETSSVKINASQVNGTLNVVAVAIVGGNEVAHEYITLTNADDGVGIKSITRYYTTNDKAEGVTAGGQNWSTKPTTPTADKKYMWSYDVITYTNDTSLVTNPAVIGARGDDGLDADTTGITEALEKAKQELTALSANIEKVRNDSLAAVGEAKQQLTTVADDLSKAKTDFQNAVSEVDTKATNLQSDVSNLNTSLSNTAKALQTQGTTLANQAKELQTQASQLTAQAKAQETLTTRVENVETTANGTKTTVSELSKTVTQNGKDITSVSNRTKTVETSLTSAKTSISELQTSVSTAQTDLTNLTKRTKTVEDGLTGTKTNLSELTQTVSSDGRTIASLTSRTKTVEDSVSGLKTTMSSVQKDLTAVTTRTKTVEDDLSGTKTTLSQVKMTADSTSQKTATLETGLSGLSAKFDSLKIGSRNYFKNSKSRKYYIDNTETQDVRTFIDDDFWQNDTRFTKDYVRMSFDIGFNPALPSDFTTDVHFSASPWYNCGGITFKGGTTDLQHFDLKFNMSGASKSYKTDNVFIRLDNTLPLNTAVSLENFNLYLSAVVEDYSQNEAELEQKIAEYKQNADQNYASLQSTVQNLDGTVQHNKTVAEQTAEGFKTRIESLETYKSGESTRANQYFELAKTETARQLTVERTAIAKDYVAKSTYTSDVTGIRNELSATTTTANTIKTNLANYQATNDKAVANLQSNLQTANGNISSLKTKVEAVPGQITSAVSAVEGKIPKSVGAVNLFKGSRDFSGTNWINNSGVYAEDYQGVKIFKTQDMWGGRSQYFEVKTGEEYVFSAYVKSSAKTDRVGFYLVHSSKQPQAAGVVSFDSVNNQDVVEFNLSDEYKRIAIKIKITKGGWIMPRLERDNNDAYLFFGGYKLERGNIATDWTPAPEDTVSQISSLSSQIQQTADGMTLLATKTELNSAKTELQSGITTATNKANSNAQTISTHTTQISALNTGLSAKVSQSDFNTLSGRVTTAENNITAKANELSSKITSVESKIPTSAGGRNYIKNSEYRKTSIYVNDSQVQDEAFDISTAFWQNSNVYAKKIKLSFYYQPSVAYATERQFSVYFRASPWPLIGVVTYPANTTRLIKYTIAMTNGLPANFTASQIFMRFNGNLDKGRYHDISKVMLEVSDVFSDWQPAPEDYDSKLASAQSEIKQTTDAITASVSALDKSTVKSASLTINTDGIVMKAGKSTTDVANAIGSYFAVNQNAINLFADKIKVKGDMIVDGAITGDKIKANSVDVTKIVGIDADYIKAKIEYAMIDWLKGKTITAYNDNMTIDLQNGRISFKDGSNAVYRQTPDGIHTGFMHFEAGSQGGIYAAFGATSTRQGINSKSSEFAGIRCYRVSANGDSHDAKIDKIEVIGDAVQFGHGYRSDGQIGGGFIMDTAAFGNDTPYSLNRVIKSIEALWRILHDHAKNTGYRFNDSAFISALNNEYNTWHDMHNR